MRILLSSPQRPFLVVGSLERGGKKKRKTRGWFGRRKKGSARGPMGIFIPFIKAAIAFYGTVSNRV